MERQRKMTAVGYLRLSKWEEASTSPARQRKAIEKLAAERGWDLAHVYEDIDISGWNGARRPGLEAMLVDLAGVDVVAVYRIDRLARSNQEFVRILRVLEEAHVALAATDMTLDDTPSGTFVRDLIARLAQLESDNISARSRAVMAHKRERGDALGRVPFGWRRVGKHFEKDPEQQAKLREAATRYVGGESFSSIAKDLGFQTAPLIRMLRSQRVQDALGDDLAGPLASALVARKMLRVPTSKQSLLGGLAVCGVCGGRMVSSSTRAGRGGKQWRAYRCSSPGHAGVSGPWLDQYVTAQVLDAVDSKKLIAAIRKRKPKARTRKASEVEARMALLDEQFTMGKVTAERFKRMNAALVEELGKATKAERSVGVSIPVELARDLSGKWETLSIETRRQFIAAVLERIEIAPATGHGPVDPGRVRLVWRA